MKSIWARLTVLIAGLFILGGCATDLKISGISVSVMEVRPSTGSSFTDGATVTLRYMNESVVPIAVSESTHRLYLNGTYVGKTTTKDAVGLPRFNIATQTVTLEVENPQALEQLKGSNSLSYEVQTVLRVEAGDKFDNVKIKGSGQLGAAAFGPKQ